MIDDTGQSREQVEQAFWHAVRYRRWATAADRARQVADWEWVHGSHRRSTVWHRRALTADDVAAGRVAPSNAMVPLA